MPLFWRMLWEAIWNDTIKLIPSSKSNFCHEISPKKNAQNRVHATWIGHVGEDFPKDKKIIANQISRWKGCEKLTTTIPALLVKCSKNRKVANYDYLCNIKKSEKWRIRIIIFSKINGWQWKCWILNIIFRNMCEWWMLTREG